MIFRQLDLHQKIGRRHSNDSSFCYTGEGISDLLDSIILVSEVLELKTNHEGPAAGIVLESGVKKGEGAVATLLVKKGTLKTGDLILVGDQYRKIRSLKNFLEESIESAPPSHPVFISGLEYSPNAGDEFIVVKDEKAAKALSENNKKIKIKGWLKEVVLLMKIYSLIWLTVLNPQLI